MGEQEDGMVENNSGRSTPEGIHVTDSLAVAGTEEVDQLAEPMERLGLEEEVDDALVRATKNKALNQLLDKSESRILAEIVVLCEALLHQKMTGEQRDKVIARLTPHLMRAEGFDNFLQRTRNRTMHALIGNGDGYGAALAEQWNKLMHSIHGNTDPVERVMSESPTDTGEEMKKTSRSDSGPGKVDIALAKAIMVPPDDLGARTWATVAQAARRNMNLISCWDNNTEIKQFVPGGRHMHPQKEVNYDVGAGVIDFYRFLFEIVPVQSPKSGPPVSLGALYSTAASVVDGANPGAVSSPLRMNLTQIVGNLNMLSASSIGDNLKLNVGTSTADIALRALLMLGQRSMLDESEDWITANVTYTLVNASASPAEASLTGQRFPLSVNAGPADITATICSFNTFMRVYAGIDAPVAGFEPVHWGACDADGVAVVPFRTSWANSPGQMAAWMLCHMDAPFAWYEWPGSLVAAVTGDVISAAGDVYNVMDGVHVPGPTAKVIFVCTDLELESVAGLYVGERAGPVNVTVATHNLVGGAAVSINASMGNWIDNDIAYRGDDAMTALQWWNAIAGNRDDWISAFTAASAQYGLWEVKPKRVADTLTDDTWYDVPGDPWDDSLITMSEPGATPSQYKQDFFQNAFGVCATYSGLLQSESTYIANLPAVSGVIGKHEALFYVGLAARLYRMAEPADDILINTYFTAIASKMKEANKLLAAATDYAVQRKGIPEGAFLSPGSSGSPAAVTALGELGWTTIQEAVKRMTPNMSYRPDYTVNRGNDAYSSLVGATWWRHPYARVHPVILANAIEDEGILCRVGDEGLKSLGWDVVADQGVYYDAISKTVFDYIEDANLENKIRRVLSVGGWTNGNLTDLSGLVLVDRLGANLNTTGVAVGWPTASTCVYRQQLNYGGAASGITMKVMEYILSAPPVGFFGHLGMRVTRLAMANNRGVTRSEEGVNEYSSFVYKGSVIEPLDGNYKDEAVITNDELLKLVNFRA
jgi:hypothetical protein